MIQSTAFTMYMEGLDYTIKIIRTILLLSLFISIAGCSTNEEYLKSRIYFQNSQSVPVLGAGDVIHIKVFREPDLTGDYEVGQDGKILFPLIGSIKVEGLNTEDVAQKIQNELIKKGFLKDPFVSVVVKKFRSKRIYVLGQVARPGTLIYQEGMTIVQAIAQAGGFKKAASTNHVIVTRMTKKGKQKIIVPVEKITEGKAPNFTLAPGDIVYVPESIL